VKQSSYLKHVEVLVKVTETELRLVWDVVDVLEVVCCVDDVSVSVAVVTHTGCGSGVS
jgi:hypothetical protein